MNRPAALAVNEHDPLTARKIRLLQELPLDEALSQTLARCAACAVVLVLGVTAFAIGAPDGAREAFVPPPASTKSSS